MFFYMGEYRNERAILYASKSGNFFYTTVKTLYAAIIITLLGGFIFKGVPLKGAFEGNVSIKWELIPPTLTFLNIYLLLFFYKNSCTYR
jgi:hypothetical protein